MSGKGNAVDNTKTEGPCRIVTALKAVITDGHRALIVRRAPDDDVAPGSWEFPGGKIEFGEALEEALRREVREETGLVAEVGALLYATTFLTGPGRQIVLLCYACTPAGAAGVRLSAEHTDFRWAGRAEMETMLPESILRDLAANDVCGRLQVR